MENKRTTCKERDKYWSYHSIVVYKLLVVYFCVNWHYIDSNLVPFTLQLLVNSLPVTLKCSCSSILPIVKGALSRRYLCVLVKLLKCLTWFPFANIKIALRAVIKKVLSDFFWEEQSMNSFSVIFPKYTGRTWKIGYVLFRFNLGHWRPNTINTSFCVAGYC